MTLPEYPYLSGFNGNNGICKLNDFLNKKIDPGTIPQSVVRVPIYNTDALISAITRQPVVVALDARSAIFQNYVSGVINSPDCFLGSISHGMLAVGYGVRNGVQYIKFKNQYGSHWGEKGYVYIQSENSDGKCGILVASPVYPVL